MRFAGFITGRPGALARARRRSSSCCSRAPRWARRVYAVGLNRDASHYAGVGVRRIDARRSTSISGVTAGLARVPAHRVHRLELPRLRDATYQLASIAAVVLGGTSIFGGRGGYLGTIAGVLIIVLLQSILRVIGIPQAGQYIAYGVVILVMILSSRRDVTAMTTIMNTPKCSASTVRDHLGEGPWWDAARGPLWWVDILGRRIRRATLDGVEAAPIVTPERGRLRDPGRRGRCRRGAERRDSRGSDRTGTRLSWLWRGRPRSRRRADQRRQDRSPRPGLVRHDAPRRDRAGRTPVPAAMAGSTTDAARRHHDLERPRLVARRPDLLLHRLDGAHDLGVRLRPGQRRSSRIGACFADRRGLLPRRAHGRRRRRGLGARSGTAVGSCATARTAPSTGSSSCRSQKPTSVSFAGPGSTCSS